MAVPRILYELTEHPWQAIGSIDGREFYFHAHHSNWTFEVADDFGSLPSDTGNNPVFHVLGRFPMVDERMTRPDAVKIIDSCAATFLLIGRPNAS